MRYVGPAGTAQQRLWNEALLRLQSGASKVTLLQCLQCALGVACSGTKKLLARSRGEAGPRPLLRCKEAGVFCSCCPAAAAIRRQTLVLSAYILIFALNLLYASRLHLRLFQSCCATAPMMATARVAAAIAILALSALASAQGMLHALITTYHSHVIAWVPRRRSVGEETARGSC